MFLRPVLLSALIISICSGCSVAEEILSQDPQKQEAFLVVEVEESAKNHKLYKIGEHETTPIWEGEEGSFLYHSATDHL